MTLFRTNGFSDQYISILEKHVTVDENCHVLVVCVYMPCDTQSISHIATYYENVLNSLEVFLQSTECNAIIILCGDWNTSFARQNVQTICLLDFMSRCDLKAVWDHDNATMGNTYVNNALGHLSCIDHFITTNNIFCEVPYSGIVDDIANQSTHMPVELCFSMNGISRMTIAAEHANSSNKLQWYKMTCSDITAYQHSLDTELCNIEVSDVMHCKSMHCKNNIHINHIEEICSVSWCVY